MQCVLSPKNKGFCNFSDHPVEPVIVLRSSRRNGSRLQSLYYCRERTAWHRLNRRAEIINESSSSLCCAQLPELDSVDSVARFDAMAGIWGKTLSPSAHGNNSCVNWSYSKTAIENNSLRGKLDHDCVLFVQHPLEKGQSEALRSGSFVACAEVLSNCDDATEGGIPRSSR
jgi:hypothetical protein